ncbi:hypothetical protein [Nonomuraea guangzhouensis]|uniref:Uncharacterized protein n=1 Tax=Nonomuraea guangzhouensis TaxID=1291555 RepID=A0ABW4GTW8_9ACTN|nr:hypothetical protein [Nonomuraea guangzhouensis]
MEELADGVRRSVRGPFVELRTALESGDSYAARVHTTGLEGLLRLAEDHHVALTSAEEA